MAKNRLLVVAISMCAVCLAATVGQAKTGTSARASQRAHGRIDVAGEVLRVDSGARSMTLRSGGNTMNFDISNPVLQGYGSIAAIRKGDRVGAGYTPDGIHITKLSRIAVQASPEKAFRVGVPSVHKPKKPSLFARRTKTDGNSFADVDNSKDGKISPIELSVVIPNLTMEQFRQYDKNHDGHLDKAEFEQVKLP